MCNILDSLTKFKCVYELTNKKHNIKKSYEFETLNLNRELAPKECTLVFSNNKKKIK